MKKNLVIILVVGLVLIVGASLFYLSTTKDGYTSSNLGTFGDFINPFIAIINLILVGYLTFVISSLEGERNKESLNSQKVIVQSQMRMDVIKNFSEQLDYYYKGTIRVSESEANHSLTFLVHTIFNFRNNNYYLFKNLFTEEFEKDVYNPFLNCANTLCTKFLSIPKDRGTNKEIQELVQIYHTKRIEFIAVLNKFTIEQMEAN